MTDEQTREEREFLEGWERKRRARRRRIWLIVLGAVLLLVVLPLLAAFGYDSYWSARVRARVAALRAQAKMPTFQQMLDRDKALPRDRNLALVYRSAFGLLRQESRSELLRTLSEHEVLGVRPSQEMLDLLAAEKKDQSGALGAILSAPPLREGAYPLPSAPSPWAIMLPHCGQLRRAVRLCARIAVLHAASGRPAQAVPCLLAGFGLASSVGSKAFLVEDMVRIGADGISREALERCLGLSQFTPDELQTLKARIERERDELTLLPALAYERTDANYMCMHIAALREFMQQTNSGAPPAGYGLVPGRRQKIDLFALAMIDHVEQIWELPPRRALAEMVRYTDALEPGLQASSPRGFVCLTQVYGLRHGLESWLECKTTLSLTAAALAAEQYRLRNGRWPETLDDLVPDFLDAVPEDYFAAGKIIYKRTKTGVVLYSVGPDGQDDGGIPRQEVMAAPAASRPSGYDLPFRLLDPELRGAKTATFRDEVVRSGPLPDELKDAGLDGKALKDLGLTDNDMDSLRGRR